MYTHMHTHNAYRRFTFQSSYSYASVIRRLHSCPLYIISHFPPSPTTFSWWGLPATEHPPAVPKWNKPTWRRNLTTVHKHRERQHTRAYRRVPSRVVHLLEWHGVKCDSRRVFGLLHHHWWRWLVTWYWFVVIETAMMNKPSCSLFSWTMHICTYVVCVWSTGLSCYTNAYYVMPYCIWWITHTHLWAIALCRNCVGMDT